MGSRPSTSIYDNSDDFELMYDRMHSGIYSWYDTRSDIREYIRLVHYPTFPRNTNGHLVTHAHYPAFVRQIRRYQFHFAALFDADEFLVLKTDKFDNVVDFMDHYCPKAVVDIQSKTIYTSTSDQKECQLESLGSQSGFVKAIVRPTYVAYRSRHYVHVVDLKKGDL